MLWARPAPGAVYPTLTIKRPAWRSFALSLLLHSAVLGTVLAWTPKAIEVARTYEVELLTAPPTYTLTPAPKKAEPPPKPPEPPKETPPPPPRPEPIVIAVAQKPQPAPAPIAQIPKVASTVPSPLRIAVASAPVAGPAANAAQPAVTNTALAVASGHGAEEVSDPAYISSVRSAIARHLRYPELALRRGTEGRVVLRLTLDARGQLLASAANEPADDRALLGAALAAVRRAAPFPPWHGVHNPDATLNLTLPIRFKIEER